MYRTINFCRSEKSAFWQEKTHGLMIENGSLVREDVTEDACNRMITFFLEKSVKYFFAF